MPHKDPEVARAWRRKWWARSPEIRDKQNARTRAMRKRINEMLRAHKVAVGCADCGYKGHHAALEFHHLGDDKDINLSFAKSLAQAEREMEKCEVLCSNCHRIRHWNEAHPCKPDIFAATYEPVPDDAPSTPQADAEPAVWVQSNHLDEAKRNVFMARLAPRQVHPDYVPLYTHPAPNEPQAEPKREPLSDEQIDAALQTDPAATALELMSGSMTVGEFKLALRRLDFISENGTASEGVQHYLDRYVRAALAAINEVKEHR